LHSVGNHAAPNYKSSHPLVISIRLSLYPDETLGAYKYDNQIQTFLMAEEQKVYSRNMQFPKRKTIYSGRNLSKKEATSDLRRGAHSLSLQDFHLSRQKRPFGRNLPRRFSYASRH
jgi:hypothetical protein